MLEAFFCGVLFKTPLIYAGGDFIQELQGVGFWVFWVCFFDLCFLCDFCPSSCLSKYVFNEATFYLSRWKEVHFNMKSVFVKLFRLTALETEVLFLSTKQVQREQQQQQCKLQPTAYQSAANPDLERDL